MKAVANGKLTDNELLILKLSNHHNKKEIIKFKFQFSVTKKGHETFFTLFHNFVLFLSTLLRKIYFLTNFFQTSNSQMKSMAAL